MKKKVILLTSIILVIVLAVIIAVVVINKNDKPVNYLKGRDDVAVHSVNGTFDGSEFNYIRYLHSIEDTMIYTEKYRYITVESMEDFLNNKEKIKQAIDTGKVSLIIKTDKKADYDLMMKTIKPEITEGEVSGDNFQAIGFYVDFDGEANKVSSFTFSAEGKHKKTSDLFLSVISEHVRTSES